MSQPTSPLLVNSTFAQFDYFASAPILTLSLTASPTSSASAYSPRPLSTPERSRTPSPCPLDFNPTLAHIAATQVLASPQSARKKEAAARRSVQVTEKSSVNWARPLRVEPEASSDMRIFGASLQRSRRLNRNTFPSPSSSSDEGPLTPSPVLPLPMQEDPDLPSRCWSVATQGKGLGVSGVAEWDTPVTQIRELPHYPDGFSFEPLRMPSAAAASSSKTSLKRATAPTPSPSRPRAQITPPNPRILATSHSLNSFSSPSTLLELQHLRQAASELESEARKPIRVGMQARGVQRDRKIKRKAVPSIIESTLVESASASASSSSSSSSSIHSIPESGPAIPNRHSSLIEQVIVPRELPGVDGGNGIFARHRQFYQNHLATQSVIEMSPRSRAVPGPIRIMTSPIRAHPTSIEHDSCSSSSLSLSDQDHEQEPVTPTSLSASQTEYFLASVETAFRKLEVERAEIQQRTGGTCGTGSLGAKHRRGFSRFLGK